MKFLKLFNTEILVLHPGIIKAFLPKEKYPGPGPILEAPCQERLTVTWFILKR